jgi:hypothetical protein
MYPVIGLDPADLREALDQIKTRDRDECAAAFISVADRYVAEGHSLEKSDPAKADTDYVRAWRLFGAGAANTGSEFDIGAVAFNTSAFTISGTDDGSSPSGANCSQNCDGNGLEPNNAIGNNGAGSTPYTFSAVSNSSFTFSPSAAGQGIFGNGNLLVYSVSPTKVVFMQIGATSGFGGFTPASAISTNPAELFIGQH